MKMNTLAHTLAGLSLILVGCACPAKIEMGITRLPNPSADRIKQLTANPSKVAYICPGETVTIAWRTKDAQSVSFAPTLGSTSIPAGISTFTTRQDTTIVGSAAGTLDRDTCHTRDQVEVFVVDDGDKITFVVGRDANGLYEIQPSDSFFSPNIKVRSITLKALPETESKWQVRHFSTDGAQTTYDMGNGLLSVDGRSVGLLGTWQIASDDRTNKKTAIDLVLEVHCPNH